MRRPTRLAASIVLDTLSHCVCPTLRTRLFLIKASASFTRFVPTCGPAVTATAARCHRHHHHYHHIKIFTQRRKIIACTLQETQCKERREMQGARACACARQAHPALSTPHSPLATPRFLLTTPSPTVGCSKGRTERQYPKESFTGRHPGHTKSRLIDTNLGALRMHHHSTLLYTTYTTLRLWSVCRGANV